MAAPVAYLPLEAKGQQGQGASAFAHWHLGIRTGIAREGFYVYPTLPGPLPFPGAFLSTYGGSGRVFCPVVQIHERRQEPADLHRILHRVARSLGSSPVLVGRSGLGSRELVHLDCNCEI